MILLIVYSILEDLSKTIIKNPLFILENDKLYYLITNKWYDIFEYNFIDKMKGKYDYFETFIMSDKAGKIIFSEQNWYLKKEDNLKGYIKYRKLQKMKQNRQ